MIRAVRLLPDAVKIGYVQAQDASAPDDLPSIPEAPEPPESPFLREIETLKEQNGELKKNLEAAQASAARFENEIPRIRKEVEDEKAQLQEKAKFELAREKEEASRSGHEAGYKKGYEEGSLKAEEAVKQAYAERLDESIHLLEQIHESVAAARDTLVAHQSDFLIRLWESMLERMLYSRVKLDPHVVERALAEILHRTSDRERIQVYLNPEDMPLVEAKRDELLDSLRGIQHFELLADEHVGRGSCLVETAMGIYDARWKTQLEQISTEVDRLLTEGQSQEIEPTPQE